MYCPHCGEFYEDAGAATCQRCKLSLPVVAKTSRLQAVAAGLDNWGMFHAVIGWIAGTATIMTACTGYPFCGEFGIGMSRPLLFALGITFALGGHFMYAILVSAGEFLRSQARIEQQHMTSTPVKIEP